MAKKLILIFFCLFHLSLFSFANDTLFIKVHFLYGSKPEKRFKNIEKKWFGGIHGGHVGIEYADTQFIDFMPSGKFHYIAKKKNFHSRFALHSPEAFWGIFGGELKNMKLVTFIIPVTKQQKKQLDSLVVLYSTQTPYDYAFIGMRCASATYDILSQAGIVKKYNHNRTIRKYFYPKKLRIKLFKLADKYNWEIVKQDGIYSRKWEKD